MKADVDAKTKVEADSANNGKELNVVCYSCSDIGQCSIGCNRPRICFICHQTNHVVESGRDLNLLPDTMGVPTKVLVSTILMWRLEVTGSVTGQGWTTLEFSP